MASVLLRRIVVVVTLAVVAGACSSSSPAAPDCVESGLGGLSCGGGAGPGPVTRALVVHRVYLGECTHENTELCVEEVPVTNDLEATRMAPGSDDFRFIKRGMTYTSIQCVEHPRVQGRRIDVYFSAHGQRFQTVFNEASTPSPMCWHTSFVMHELGATGSFTQMVEGDGDLRESIETKFRSALVVEGTR